MIKIARLKIESPELYQKYLKAIKEVGKDLIQIAFEIEKEMKE